MSKTLRPSLETFRRYGWLPRDQKTYDAWMEDLVRRIKPAAQRMPGPGGTFSSDIADDLLEPIKEFKTAIETNAVVYTDIVRMFDGMTESPKTYQEMLLMFNEIFRQAPSFGDFGPPMYMIMANVMNTQGGFSAFTKQTLNSQFKKMLKTWEAYLLSKDSVSVLNTSDNGWLSTTALGKMLDNYQAGRTFDQVFICDSSKEFYGFYSYEEFFVRRYRSPEIDRPTGDLNNFQIVSAPCESALYAIQRDVQLYDELFIKDEAYSLVHLLANDESVADFVDGTVIQTFLSTYDYHRWHAPVNGVIKKIVDVPGTYFAQAPSTLDDPDPTTGIPYLHSLRYFANTATRQLLFIEAENKAIGLMCFIAIGMTEISTCQSTVFEGQSVRRGDELGMFHFGGSSCAMVFRKEAEIQVDGDFTETETHYPINRPIAVAAID